MPDTTGSGSNNLQSRDLERYPPEARGLAKAHLSTLQALPLVLAAVVLREVARFDWQFPAERDTLLRQLAWLEASGLKSGTVAAFRPFGQELPAELRASPWGAEPSRFVEQLSSTLWATHRMDAFRAAAEAYNTEVLRAAAAESTGPEPRRLCLVAVGEGVPPGTLPLFRKLRRYGTYYGAVDTTGAWPAAVQAVAQRAEAGPAPFAHWYVDGGVATRTSSAVSALSWAQVKPLRLLLLGRMQQATATPGGGPEALRSALAELRPEQFAQAGLPGSPVLQHFALSLLTEGSGTQIFSTTFVQWAAREVLRRAEPETLLLRFAGRQRERPMNDMLLVSRDEDTIDLRGSLVDADMGTFYTWLNLQRLPGAAQSRFVVWHVGGREALAVAPQLQAGAEAGEPCTLAKILAQAG